MSKPVVLNVSEWTPSSVKYMPPKVNKSGGKAISIISKQTNRSLHISSPLMMTWGIADFVDDNGVADGKFSITLNFPNEEYRTSSTDTFLQKFKDFENQILDDAVENSELWWGEKMSREVAKHTFFPILKYSKNKDTKKVDLTKPPSIRAKVPYYDGKWGVEIYDTSSKMLFPSEDPAKQNLIPSDFVTKLSSVACVLQCGGIWIGGKGWGLTWKLIQCIVKPRDIVSVYGRCHIELSNEDKVALESQTLAGDDVVEEDEVPAVAAPISTEVEDSDEEAEDEPEPEPVAAPVPVVKKVVKKAAPAPEPVADSPVAAAVVDEAPKKKVVKKVVKATA